MSRFFSVLHNVHVCSQYAFLEVCTFVANKNTDYWNEYKHSGVINKITETFCGTSLLYPNSHISTTECKAFLDDEYS